MTVSYEDGRITAVTVGENNETPGIGDQAINTIPGRIVEEQSLTVDIRSRRHRHQQRHSHRGGRPLSRPAAWM